jgi:outer membrane protein TolC
MQTVAAQQAIKSRLVASIASNYYQLLALDQQKRIAEETIENRRKSIETIQALKMAGSVTEVAIKQNEAQWLNARALLVDINNNIHLLENAFCILLEIRLMMYLVLCWKRKKRILCCQQACLFSY